MLCYVLDILEIDPDFVPVRTALHGELFITYTVAYLVGLAKERGNHSTHFLRTKTFYEKPPA